MNTKQIDYCIEVPGSVPWWTASAMIYISFVQYKRQKKPEKQKVWFSFVHLWIYLFKSNYSPRRMLFVAIFS